MRRTQSLQWKLPIINSALLLLIIVALVAASYFAVRQTTVTAATARLQNVALQIAALLEASVPRTLASAKRTADRAIVRDFLRKPSAATGQRVSDSLHNTPIGTEQVVAVELRDPRGRRVLAWGAIDRVNGVKAPELDQMIARRDSGTIGSFHAVGDTVFYPVGVPIRDNATLLGYVVEWRRQTSTAQTRDQLNQLMGTDVELLLTDTTQAVWTDLVRAVPGPPIRMVPGVGSRAGEIARYTRGLQQDQFAIAVLGRGTPWIALVEVPSASVYGPSRSFLRWMSAAAVGVFGLALLLTWMTTRTVTRPLHELAAAADAITAGDRARRVNFERADELGRLAAAFNRLAAGVEVTHQQAEDRFRLLVDSVRDYAIYILDPSGRIVTWNEGAARLKGYDADEIIGQHFSVFYQPDDQAGGKPEMDLRVATDEGRVQDEGWRVRKDGTRFWASALITALRNPSGELVGFAKVTRDMTERRQGEEALLQRSNELDQALTQLREAQERLVRREKLAILGQLASGVGHELRNPLGVMTNAIYYLETVLGEAPENVKEYLGILRGQIDLSEKIVSDLLDFARVKPPQRAAVTLRDVVERQIERAGRMDHVNLKLEIPASVPPVLADQVQVGQIVLNLLTNAVQAMGERGGILTIRAEVDGSRVRLVVKDEGQGIAPENMDKIFEPLFTTKARGMGLGLAVSRALAVANGGDITVESRHGHGATFTLILPQVGQVIAA